MELELILLFILPPAFGLFALALAWTTRWEVDVDARDES
jgi:hypothetical protein